MSKHTPVLAGIAIACGIAYAGWTLGHAYLQARAAERVVTVKGLSEREVEADLVLWPIVFQARGAKLAEVHAEIERDAARIRRFLLERGIPESEISRSEPGVTDYGPGTADEPIAERFAIQATITVRSTRVDAVSNARPELGTLVGEGVELPQQWGSTTEYVFTGLDALKPDMIAEATRDARRAAQQFALDSGSQVGSIRTAQQGYFSIADRDKFSPQVKRVRVVTTVQYYLIDG
ncbi:MAG: SIMPL domain-containing protein [Myxococcota bacterium]|nr:SIMPL domain-containing protein [Myxococcota bacterium]